MKNIILSALLFFIISSTSFAQQMLHGKVTDAATGKPLAGASVTFAGTGGTTTDNDGNFSIDCNKTKKITVSFVGYQTYSANIKNCDAELKISLETAGRTLENVEISATSSINKALLYQPALIPKFR